MTAPDSRPYPYSRRERAALCELFEDLGPGAPTLCAGWTAHDLAAHLVVRERRPDAGVGIVVGPVAGWTERVRRAYARRSFGHLVNLVRSGPPVWSPFGLPFVEPRANTVEYFVHHEDVRRAQRGWEPRMLPPRLEEALWRAARGPFGRFLFRRVPVGVTLRRLEGGTAPVRPGEPRVFVEGMPSELLLYAFGRGDHTRVSYDGDEGAVARLRESRLGL